MDDFYREVIIDRYKNPQMRGELEPNDYSYQDDNPLCGDEIRIDLRVDEQNKVTEAAFAGHGCAISMASADLLVESLIGKPIEDIRSLSKEDILELLGIELGPVRLKCALLSLKVLKAGIYGMDEIEYLLLRGEIKGALIIAPTFAEDLLSLTGMPMQIIIDGTEPESGGFAMNHIVSRAEAFSLTLSRIIFRGREVRQMC